MEATAVVVAEVEEMATVVVAEAVATVVVEIKVDRGGRFSGGGGRGGGRFNDAQDKN